MEIESLLNGNSSVGLDKIGVCYMLQSVVAETALIALSSRLLFLFKTSPLLDANMLADLTATDNRFPLGELNRLEKPAAENMDGGGDAEDTESDDDDDDDDEDDEDDDDEDDGEEESEDEDDSDAEPFGDGESDDEDDDDSDDSDDDDDDDGDEEDEEDEESDEEDGKEMKVQPPFERKK